MALTPSTMTRLGSPCPDFALPDTTGRIVHRDDFAAASALVIVVMCNHCPYVVHVREGLAALGRDLRALGVAMLGLNANDAERYPADGPEAMAREVASQGYVFPYLYDETQDVARALGAACTPDVFVFGADRALVYRGQLDDSRPGNGVPVSGASVREAVRRVLAGEPPLEVQRPSLGCNVKWRAAPHGA